MTNGWDKASLVNVLRWEAQKKPKQGYSSPSISPSTRQSLLKPHRDQVPPPNTGAHSKAAAGQARRAKPHAVGTAQHRTALILASLNTITPTGTL